MRVRVIEKTERTTVKRLPSRGDYDRATINCILDEGLICHVGFIVDGQPRVIPTGYVRVDDNLYIHGSPASVMLRSAVKELDVCVTITLLDGLVLARSAFHHSMNYRSVVVYGRARLVDDAEEKLTAMRRFVEHVVPGRWSEVRGPNPAEFKGTTVLAIPINEASAKIRIGPP
ncbi:MAG: pyridoxamine 5'-phosphate oxidase family protein, partial [Blastocatellia bacterium]